MILSLSWLRRWLKLIVRAGQAGARLFAKRFEKKITMFRGSFVKTHSTRITIFANARSRERLLAARARRHAHT